MVVFKQSGFTWSELLYSGKVVARKQIDCNMVKLVLFGHTVCRLSKLVVFGQIGSIRAK